MGPTPLSEVGGRAQCRIPDTGEHVCLSCKLLPTGTSMRAQQVCMPAGLHPQELPYN